MRHIGVQHDGINNLVTGETNKVDNKSLDHKNKVSRFPAGLVSELDDGVTSEPGGLQVSDLNMLSSLFKFHAYSYAHKHTHICNMYVCLCVYILIKVRHFCILHTCLKC